MTSSKSSQRKVRFLGFLLPVSCCICWRYLRAQTLPVDIPHPPPAPPADWPEPGDASDKDVAAYWQEDWDNGTARPSRSFTRRNFLRMQSPPARCLSAASRRDGAAEDIDADFAQQLRVELQKSDVTKH